MEVMRGLGPWGWLSLAALALILALEGACSEERYSKEAQNSLPTSKLTNSSTPAPTKVCRPPCSNGICDPVSGSCTCYPGWRGDQCDLCGGKIRFNTTKGWLADATGNYTVDTKCTWLIEAPSPTDRIRIHLKEFATECGWDHLYVFDGDSVFSDWSAVFSGLVRYDRYAVQQVPEVVGQSGSMLIHFYSDVAYNMTGFNITFSINSCPSERHDLTCSGHGTCLSASGECQCDEDFKGPACNIPACPKNCEPDGVRRGRCDKVKKKCECIPGFTGEACSQSVKEGYWQVLNTTGFQAPIPRTSHAAMVDNSGKMWIVGGETFSHSKYMVATLTPDMNNEEVQGIWRIVHAHGEKGPSPRFGHSAVMHDEKIYMYGGTMKSGHTSRELWSLDLNTLTWERVETNQGRCMISGSSGQAKLCGPVHSMGHTANVISNRMIVIFGHSPKYGYLSTVQEYHFGNREWSIVPASGYPVRGGFGHSSVWDEITNLIYVYGGYVSTASTAAGLANDLYSFDPIVKKWTYHSPGLSPRYLHSAVASNGLMIVYGGNTHNDTSWSQGAKCYSSDVLVYDILCDTWHNIQNTLPQDLSADLPRFGHSAVLLNGTMLIYGGFHGILKGDTLAYVPGSCDTFKSRTTCLTGMVGVKCVWNSKKEQCELHPPNRAKSGIETCLSKKQSESRHNFTEMCATIETCASCTSTSFNCVWCGPAKCRWRNCADDPKKSRQARVNSHLDDGNDTSEMDSDMTVPATAGDNFLEDKSMFVSLQKASPSASPASSHRTISRLDECLDVGEGPSPKDWCPSYHTCHSCTAIPGCTWDIDKNSRCKEASRRKGSGIIPSPPPTEHSKTFNSNANSTEDLDVDMESETEGQVDERRKDFFNVEPDSTSSCSPPCSDRTSCSNCTHGLCMWCRNLEMCIERNAYLASFPYGQCMDWTTQPTQCGSDEGPDDMCSSHKTCTGCRSNPACGWCDNGTGTGVGSCQVGGASGPLSKKAIGLVGKIDWIPTDTCSVDDGKSWHFTSCPDCLCNGHSTCSKDGKTCDKPCFQNTEGENCEKCSKGYFGSPVNGGECEPCQCNNQATDCNHQTGRCHCTTKGIIGDKCQSCDKVNHYYGDPVTDSCFYELAIDYQFTFNLSKSDDKHLTGINFKNTPTKMDVDVDFSITCSVPAKMNLTIRYTPNGGKEKKEQQVFLDQNCTMFKNRFSKEDFVFGMEENTTFYVYVYDFDAPLWIIISFSQHPKLDLLQFFITFSTCFLALLLIAAILWKIKQKYDRYRRRQRLFVEMEQMASRPFGSVLVELEKASDVFSGSSSSTTSTVNNREDPHIRRRRRKHRPSPIALEPCIGNRAAVLSLIVRLPTGGKPYTPNGYTGIAVASSLVTLGNPRKSSCDTGPSRSSVDDPKSGRKGRKGTSTPSVDI